MSNFKVIRHERNFLQIDKEVLFNKELSFKAKGLLATCLAFPPDWNHNIAHLSKLSTNGKDSIYSCIDELIEHGYCHRHQENNGRFSKMDYFFYETKSLNPHLNKIVPNRENPVAKVPHRENPPLLRSTLTKKEKEDCSVEGEGTPSVLKEGDPVEEKKIVFIKNSFGETLEISKQVMIEKSIQKRKDWQLSEIEEAWTILCSQNVINDPIKFLEGTINILRKKKSIQSLNKPETKKGPQCQNYLKKPSEDQMQAVHARLASGTEMHLWQAQL